MGALEVTTTTGIIEIMEMHMRGEGQRCLIEEAVQLKE